MKKSYLLICIPPTAAILVFMVIKYGFMEATPQLLPLPTQEEINAAPWKNPAAHPVRGGTDPSYDDEKYRKFIEDMNAGKTHSYDETPVEKPSQRQSPPVLTVREQQGQFREDLIQLHNDTVEKNREIVKKHNRHNHGVKLIACFAAMVVAIAGYAVVGTYLYRQYKAPKGEEELAAAVQQPAAAGGQPDAAPASGAGPSAQALTVSETAHVHESHELLCQDPEDEEGAFFAPPDESAAFFEDEAPPASKPDEGK